VGLRAVVVLVAFSALRDPSCGTNTTAGGPNAPCTRTSDCESTLSCIGGMCAQADAAPQAQPARDAGASDGSGAD